MGSYAIQNAYPEADNSLPGDGGEDDNSDFDIDSDTSNEELLELKRDLQNLGPEKAQRDLADATKAIQEKTLRMWKRYILYPAFMAQL